jgi:hypothetical protein
MDTSVVAQPDELFACADSLLYNNDLGYGQS